MPLVHERLRGAPEEVPGAVDPVAAPLRLPLPAAQDPTHARSRVLQLALEPGCERAVEEAPRGVSAQDAIAQTVKSVRKRITLYRPPYAGGKTGQIFESEWREEAKLAGLSIPDVRPLFTQELTDEINAFDKAPIIAAAKAYKA